MCWLVNMNRICWDLYRMWCLWWLYLYWLIHLVHWWLSHHWHLWHCTCCHIHHIPHYDLLHQLLVDSVGFHKLVHLFEHFFHEIELKLLEPIVWVIGVALLAVDFRYVGLWIKSWAHHWDCRWIGHWLPNFVFVGWMRCLWWLLWLRWLR